MNPKAPTESVPANQPGHPALPPPQNGATAQAAPPPTPPKQEKKKGFFGKLAGVFKGDDDKQKDQNSQPAPNNNPK
jgi:hypothetical protein